MKYPREKNSDPRNTREKILDLQNSHEKKFWTHEIPTLARLPQTHETHDSTRPTKFSTLSGTIEYVKN